MTAPDYLTAPEAAELLRTPVRTLYAWRMENYGPPAGRVGKRLLYKRADLLAWLDAQIAAGIS